MVVGLIMGKMQLSRMRESAARHTKLQERAIADE